MGIMNSSLFPPGHDHLHVVGPLHVFLSIGHWATTIYIFLSSHLAGIAWYTWVMYNRIQNQYPPTMMSTLSKMLMMPSSLITICLCSTMYPDLGSCAEVLLELVMLYGMMLYQKFIITHAGGLNNLSSLCQTRNMILPTWAPPCCLFPFLVNKPITTKTIKSIIMFPAILSSIKIASISIQIFHSLSNIRLESIEFIFSIISIPLTITTIYCFTMLNIIMEDIMAGNKTRLLGTFLLIQYVLFDSQRGFFQLLTGAGLLCGVPPYLSIIRVE